MNNINTNAQIGLIIDMQIYHQKTFKVLQHSNIKIEKETQEMQIILSINIERVY